MLEMQDRVGLGWRPPLAAEILANLDRIDVVEVIADDYFDASRRRLSPLRTLAAQVPVMLHGVSLGMASTAPVDASRLDKMARLVDVVRPEAWSEHLAFVRGGGVEIGHLAAPPRTGATVDGALRNLRTARAVVGSPPLIENIATLIEPPGGDRCETQWLAEIVADSEGAMLLDLHNLHANAVNFGFDACAALDALPLARVAQIHIAGGKWIEAKRFPGRRLLDDHLHDVPQPVYDLLYEVARRVARPLTVILERDGAFPPIERLLAEMNMARLALQRGRAARAGAERERPPYEFAAI
jgi:uncharacterized protein (UPF0276 family)